MHRSRPDELYHAVTRLFAAVIAGFGVAIVAVTLASGGGPTSVGLLIGILFVALGVGRLLLSRRGYNSASRRGTSPRQGARRQRS